MVNGSLKRTFIFILSVFLTFVDHQNWFGFDWISFLIVLVLILIVEVYKLAYFVFPPFLFGPSCQVAFDTPFSFLFLLTDWFIKARSLFVEVAPFAWVSDSDFLIIFGGHFRMRLVQIEKGLQFILELQNIDLFAFFMGFALIIIFHAQLVKRLLLSVSSHLNFACVLEY